MGDKIGSAAGNNNANVTTTSWPWAKWKQKIAEVLSEIKDVKGDFATGGLLKNAPYTTIAIEGVGKVNFPVYEEKASDIIKVCEQAPFGRKAETIVDTSVRNSWQLSPDAFKILNPRWESYMSEGVLPVIAKGLGIQTPIKSTLYKLLLYQTGSFFKTHRDSEKEDRMFGTLIIQMPSEYEGGQLVVKHDTARETFDFSSTEPNIGNEFCVFYSAFYCDCEHEVLPVTSGYRVCLVYNLMLIGTDVIPVTPELYGAKMKMVHLLNLWPARKPQKIVCTLAHQYTKAGLSFHALKGCDQTVVNLFTTAARECPVILHLALVLKYETGDGQCDYDSDFSTDEESVQAEYSVNNWIAPDDSVKKYGEFSVDVKRELIPEDCFDTMSPDKEDVSERTGNEGASVERWYHRAAVVMWPKGKWKMVETSEVPQKIVFETFVDFIKENNAELAKLFESEFPLCFEWVSKHDHDVYSPSDREDCEQPALQVEEKRYKALSLIVGLGNLQILKKFLEFYYKVCPSTITLLLEQCEKYGWESLHPQLQTIMKRGEEPAEVLLQLMGSEKVIKGEKKQICEKLCKTLLDKKNSFCAEVKEKQFFENIFYVCSKGQFDLYDYVKSKDLSYRINVVAPVLAKLFEKSDSIRYDPLWKSLTYLCLSDLENIVAVKLEAPSSWRRSTDITCSNGDCSRLKSFLVMDREATTLNVAKSRHRHLVAHLGEIKDVNYQTSRNGNRVDVIIKKNRAEYDKKLKEFNRVEALLTTLKPGLSTTSSEDSFPNDQPLKKVPKLDQPANGL